MLLVLDAKVNFLYFSSNYSIQILLDNKIFIGENYKNMWIAKRIFLKEEELTEKEKHQRVDEALRKIVFPLVDKTINDDLILGWYCSRKYCEKPTIHDISVRIYLMVADNRLGQVKDYIDIFLEKNFGIVLGILDTPLDDSLVHLPFIQQACEVAKSIMKKYPEWNRQLNQTCYNEVVEEVNNLKNLMEEFTEKQKSDVTHFILQNVLFLEVKIGEYVTPASWEDVIAKKSLFFDE